MLIWGRPHVWAFNLHPPLSPKPPPSPGHVLALTVTLVTHLVSLSSTSVAKGHLLFFSLSFKAQNLPWVLSKGPQPTAIELIKSFGELDCWVPYVPPSNKNSYIGIELKQCSVISWWWLLWDFGLHLYELEGHDAVWNWVTNCAGLAKIRISFCALVWADVCQHMSIIFTKTLQGVGG